MLAAPTKIVVDSGPLVALFDADDGHHPRALEFIRQNRVRLLSSLTVITEAMYVLGGSQTAQQNLLAWIRAGGLWLVETPSADFERVGELMAKYVDLPMDFTDGVVVALCERLGVNHIASVDSDFAIYRFKGRTRFVNCF